MAEKLPVDVTIKTGRSNSLFRCAVYSLPVGSQASGVFCCFPDAPEAASPFGAPTAVQQAEVQHDCMVETLSGGEHNAYLLKNIK